MTTEQMYNKYKDVRNGQDLEDRKVIPKDPSNKLTILTYKRLIALHDKIASTLDDTLVGNWIPVFDKKQNNLILNPEVVADDKLGHKIRFKKNFKGDNWDNNNYKIDTEIPADSIGMLKRYDSDSVATISFDQLISGKKIYKFRAGELCDIVEASSLGQLIPEDREKMIFNQTMSEFFPKTRLDTDRAYRAITGMLMDKDLIFYGEPGTGKSTLARDIVSIFSQQQIRFEVDGCRFGCDPFSLFDKEYTKIVPPCPDCMIKYNGDKKIDYKETGIFVLPKPKDVPVRVVKISPAQGISYIESTSETKRMHLIGLKLPKLDGTTDKEREDQASTEGFTPGELLNSHNGILHIEELDKMRETTRDSLLEVNSNHRIKPDSVKYSFPCSNLIIATANDPTVISDPIKDRFFLLAIRHPSDVSVAQRMLRVSYHNEGKGLENIDVGDIHTEKADVLRDIPMPITLENAVTSFYYKFREEYKGPGKSSISGSNRSLIDSLDVARAKLAQDRIFFKNTPQIVNMDYTISGIQYALCARVGTNSSAEDKKAKEELKDWVDKQFPSVLSQEEDVWWCNFMKKHLSVVQAHIPEIESNCIQEIELYNKNPGNAVESYGLVSRELKDSKNKSLMGSRIQYPFMDYLFLEQPRFGNIKPDQLTQMISYFMKSQEGVSCKLNTPKK